MAEKIAKLRFLDHKIVESHFSFPAGEEVNNGLQMKFEKEVGVNEQEKRMRLTLKTNVTDETNAVNISVTLMAIFEYDGELTKEQMDVLFNYNAVAIVFPYVRAYISTMSTLSGISSIVLPTINFSEE